MERKLFCEISPFTYWISTEKEIMRRRLKDLLKKTTFAKKRTKDNLPIIVYRHNSLIRRRLGNVDIKLQENKAKNLALSVPHIDGLLIRPGEIFSIWQRIGRTTRRKGYKEGLTITKGKPTKGIGGGLCQLSNLIHWMVLHSDLTITEHHHHDALDLFPDFGRQIPFGTGTSISYNYIDYRVKNNTDNTYQLRLWIQGEYLCGELRAAKELTHTFHIHAENEYFSCEEDATYRNGQVFRDTIDRSTGQILDTQLIRTNHAKVMYDTPLPRVIRHAKPSDLPEIMQVMEAAKSIMRLSGNPHQWGEGYPSEAIILADIEKDNGFVIEKNNAENEKKIVAYFAFFPSPEPTYGKIHDGQWIDDTLPYHVVHRIASTPDVHGIFSNIMDFCFHHDSNIRIDTHRDNVIMQHNIEKHGFSYCGIIHLASGDERLAYQRILKGKI